MQKQQVKVSPFHRHIVIEEPKSKEDFGTFKDFRLDDPEPAAYSHEEYGVLKFHLIVTEENAAGLVPAVEDLEASPGDEAAFLPSSMFDDFDTQDCDSQVNPLRIISVC